MQVEINIINAFTLNGSGGNRAAVVLNGDRFSTGQKQAIAAKAGLSETAFVGVSNEADFKLDFFTPVRRIAHCGHATVAAFAYLKQTGKISGNASSKMTIDGRREIRFAGDEVYMEQRAPRFLALPGEEKSRVLNALGIPSGVAVSPSPMLVDTGNAFAIVELADEAKLQSLAPDFDAIASFSERHGLIGFYVFCQTAGATVDATARMFAPLYGISEEPATGMAAGPLACYLFAYGSEKPACRIEQGRFMKPSSPSLLKVELTVQQNKIQGLYAGGAATLITQKTITL